MSEPNTAEDLVRGVVERVTFRNPDNGYSVLRVSVPEQKDPLTLVGTVISGQGGVGTHLLARGKFVDHPKFGRQFSATSITETTPSTNEGLIKYLGSGLIKGIGPSTAEKIVAAFGGDVVDVIFQDPDKVAKLPGVGRKKAQILHEKLVGLKSVGEIMRFLLEHNISPNLAQRIFEKYEMRAVEVLSKDPYLLARDLRGVGFLTADTIAKNLGLPETSIQRLKAGLFYTLEKASTDGHCLLEQPDLINKAKALLALPEDIELVPALKELIGEGYLVARGESIFLKIIDRAEEQVAKFIGGRFGPRSDPLIRPDQLPARLATAAAGIDITLTNEQELAVKLACTEPLLIITGGPGCGKTTVVRTICSVLDAAGKKILLAAPTGRAAQRMAQLSGITASTIHRLLKYDPTKHTFLHGPDLPLSADVVIVDEASMLDITLARDLFSAIQKKTTLVLVGDKDQLPSVGPGRVLGDLISIPEVKTISLTRLFRRSEESTINGIAYTINAGTVPLIPEPDGVTKVDAYFLARNDPEEAAATIENLVADQIPRKFGIGTNDICVLTPSNRGPLGTTILNQRLQAKLNPSAQTELVQGIKTYEQEIRLGDRVCQRVNNYYIDDAGVFNGDVGQVFSVNAAAKSLIVELWDGRLITYEESSIGQLSLAYALSVHRSQGAEFPCVVLALHDSHYMLLERQLIYTAVTRAKKLLIVVGSKRALGMAVRRVSSQKRGTLLRTRILGMATQ